MNFAPPHLVLFVQVGLLLITFAGLGGLTLRLLVPRGAVVTERDAWLASVSGVTLGWLALQNLVYFNVPVSRTAWLLLATACFGLSRWGSVSFSKQGLKALRRMSVAALLVTFVQGAALAYHGPRDYYGFAHTDQVSYVKLAEFVAHTPFQTPLGSDTPVWMVKAQDLKVMRIGQSVAHAYLAVVSLTDAKQAYGAMSVLFVVLLAVAAMMMARSLGLGVTLASATGAWVGVLPAVTLMHLDGFFSQTSVMFVIPSLVVAAFVIRHRPALGLVAMTALTGWVLSAYTEVFPIIFACAALVGLAVTGLRPLWRMPLVLSAPVLAVLLVPAYSLNALRFVAMQYGVASHAGGMLDGLVPWSGSLYGWAEHFVLVPDRLVQARGVATLAGLVLLLLVLVGVVVQTLEKRAVLVAVGAPVAGALAALLARPSFPGYPFAKISVMGLPLAAYLIVRGLHSLVGEVPAQVGRMGRRPAASARRVVRSRRTATMVLVALLVCASLPGTVAKQLAVVRNTDILEVVNTPGTRKLFSELEDSPGRAFVLRERHPILNAWLAYHARHARLFSAVEVVGDREMPSDRFAFRQLPHPLGGISLLSGAGLTNLDLADGRYLVDVANPQGVERSEGITFYWLGDSLLFHLDSFASEARTARLSFKASPGPAHPLAARTLKLSGGGWSEERTFAETTWVSFDLPVPAGASVWRLDVVSPTEWLVKLPHDHRKHMVHISAVTIQPPQVASRLPAPPSR